MESSIYLRTFLSSKFPIFLRTTCPIIKDSMNFICFEVLTSVNSRLPPPKSPTIPSISWCEKNTPFADNSPSSSPVKTLISWLNSDFSFFT